MRYDVAIIGGGVIGAMIARELSRYTVSVAVIEKEADCAMGASGANSGIVHAGFDAGVGTLKARFNVEGNRLMAGVAEELGVPYRNNGSLVVGFSEDDRRKIVELYERGKRNGVERLEIIGAKRLFELEPAVNRAALCALYAPTGGIICPYGLTVAALGNAMDNGCEFIRSFEVRGIEYRAKDGVDEGIYVISDGRRSVEARYVINAAGVFADKIAAMAGDDSFTITPRKGEYMLLDKESGNVVSHTIFRTPSKLGKGILVSPTADGNLLLGPTATDEESRTDTATTVRGLACIAKECLEDVPNVPTRSVITSFAGLRAVGDSGDFIINSPKAHFYNFAGIESPGLTSAPAIAKYASELLEGDGLILNRKENFIARRHHMHDFELMSIEEKNELIKRKPEYGRIICRCERISEGEILRALTENPAAITVDGVKRRTRATMGRCGGGFCTPAIAGLIARVTGIPYEEVTKRGGESRLNLKRTKK